jgi:hypothetical protein
MLSSKNILYRKLREPKTPKTELVSHETLISRVTYALHFILLTYFELLLK